MEICGNSMCGVCFTRGSRHLSSPCSCYILHMPQESGEQLSVYSVYTRGTGCQSLVEAQKTLPPSKGDWASNCRLKLAETVSLGLAIHSSILKIVMDYDPERYKYASFSRIPAQSSSLPYRARYRSLHHRTPKTASSKGAQRGRFHVLCTH